MDIHFLGTFIKDLGLGNALSLVICIIFFFLLKWVLKSSSDTSKNAREDRKESQILLQKMIEKYDKVSEKIDIHEKESSMRGVFIKKEHESLLSSMQQVEQALGRLNGYKT